jgi:rod shape-determining protein MreC
VRQVVAVALYPLQRAVQMPGEALAFAGTYFSSQRALVGDNAQLKQQLLADAPIVQGYPQLTQENMRLRAMLAVESRFRGAATAAEVLYSGRDPFTQKIFIDKGDAAGVQPGQAVIDEIGVVGQVTRVFPYMAEVTLVTDKDHAVPVKVERTGVRSVMYGAGTGRLPELRFLSPNAEIQPGDRLVTSGIDGTYPAGLAVAQVASVERETGQMFARVTCKPLAGVDASQHVLILGNAAAAMPRPEEPAEADAPRKGRRRRG